MRKDTDLYYEHDYGREGLHPQDGGRQHKHATASAPTLLIDSNNESNSVGNVRRNISYPGNGDSNYVMESDGQGRFDIASESEGAGLGPGPAIYAGPADRSNPAVQDVIRHTVTLPYAPKNTTPTSQNTYHQGGYEANGANGGPSLPRPRSTGVFHNTKAAAGSKDQQDSKFQSQKHVQTQNRTTTHDVLASEGKIIEDAALHEHYSRVITPELAPTEEMEDVCYMLNNAMAERQKWVFKPRLGPEELSHLPEAQSMKECFTDENPFHWDNMVGRNVFPVLQIKLLLNN